MSRVKQTLLVLPLVHKQIEQPSLSAFPAWGNNKQLLLTVHNNQLFQRQLAMDETKREDPQRCGYYVYYKWLMNMDMLKKACTTYSINLLHQLLFFMANSGRHNRYSDWSYNTTVLSRWTVGRESTRAGMNSQALYWPHQWTVSPLIGAPL